MLDCAFEDVGEDLHVAVGMLAKAHGWSNIVFVDDAEGAKAHVRRIVVFGKAEAEVGVQPTVVRVSSFR